MGPIQISGTNDWPFAARCSPQNDDQKKEDFQPSNQTKHCLNASAYFQKNHGKRILCGFKFAHMELNTYLFK